jgi:hypothetical protein
MICTNDEQFLQGLCLKLRECLHEHSRQTNDPSFEMLATILEEEECLKKAS